MPNDRASDRLQVLDAFRALAVTGVVLVHFLPHWDATLPGPNPFGYREPFPAWLGYGAYGVHAFFIVSGFVILMTLERCRHLPEFGYRRFARLFPAYAVALLATALIGNTFGPPGYHSSLRDVTWGLLLVPPSLAQTRFVDGVYWSLLVELRFYLLVGLVYWLAAKRMVLAWCAMVAVAIVMWLGAGIGYDWSRAAASRLLIAQYLPHFTFGMACYCAWRHRRVDAWLFAAVAIAGYAITWAGAAMSAHVIHAILVMAMVAFLRGWLEWLTCRPLLFLGGISYALYLLHNKIGSTLIGWLTQRGGLPDLAAAALAALVCIALASALTYWVEIPAKHWLLEAAASRRVALVNR